MIKFHDGLISRLSARKEINMLARRISPNLRFFLGSLLAIFIIGGCGLTAAQRNAIKRFSRATAAVGEVTSAELLQMREATVLMNVRRLEITGIEKDEPDHIDLDENFDIEDVEARVKAAKTLQNYGELLLSLVQDTQGKDLKKAADKFVESVRGLPSADRRLTPEKLDAIGEGVQAIGGIIVEGLKAQEIKRIVEGANEQVAHLCDLLAADFDRDQDGKLASQFVLTTERLLVRADRKFRESKGREERATTLAAFHLAQTKRERYTLLDRASQAVAQMKKANSELAESMKSDKPMLKDLKELSKKVKSLLDALKVLK